MTGCCVIGIPSGRVFFQNVKGFHWTVLMDSRIEDLLRILCQGASIFAYSAQAKFPNALKKIRIAVANTEESSRYKHGS
jgi:hypothetical protein